MSTRCRRRLCTADGFEFRAGLLEFVGGETGTAVGQHMRYAEGKRLSCLGQKGNGVGRTFSIVNGQMHEAGTAVDCNMEITLADLAICGSQLRQMFDVDMDVTEIVLPKRLALWPAGTMALPGAGATSSSAISRTCVKARKMGHRRKSSVILPK